MSDPAPPGREADARVFSCSKKEACPRQEAKKGPAASHQRRARSRARNAIIDEEVASFLGDLMLEHYPTLLVKRYGFAVDNLDGVGVVEAIAKRRGHLLKGGNPDLVKAALMLLQDYRTGALGRISLETPVSRGMMLANEAVEQTT